MNGILDYYDMNNQNISNSDSMICNNSGYLLYKDNKQNNDIFKENMSNTQKFCIRNIDNENKMFLNESSKKAICNDIIKTRGNNSTAIPKINCPNKNDFDNYLLIPCQKPNYKNYLVFNDQKTCSKRHQMFNNLTKRKDSIN